MNIAERAKKLKGHVGIYFKNLTTGEVVNYNADDEYHPASVIKLPIIMAVYKMASEGKADLYEKLKVTYECRVPSCGAFNAFTDEPMVDIKTLCNLAIVISDNTASNMLVSHFGIDNLNHHFKEMGLEKTHVERLFYDDEMQEKGYNNKADQEKTEKVTICGKCCESGDILITDLDIATPEAGDTFAIFSTGAYGYKMASNYNKNTIPGVVFVKDGVDRVVVKPQTYDDMLANEIL